MALLKLGLEPRYYTYIGFAFALAGMAFVIITLLSIFNLFGFGDAILWPIPAAGAVLSLLVATISFHKMGEKKVAL